MLDDKRFWRSWLNTFVIILPSITLQLLLGLGIALLLNRIPRGKAFITSLLIIPAMVSPASAAMVWRMLFGVKYGGINNALMQAGLMDVYFDWFATPSPGHHVHCGGRSMAQYLIHDDCPAGRAAVDPTRPLRSR